MKLSEKLEIIANGSNALAAINKHRSYCIDFETYYDDEATLRRLSVARYLDHPKVHVTAVGIGNLATSEISVLHPDEFEDWINDPIRAVDVAHVIGHNLHFDGAILKRKYGFKAQYIDTLGLARQVIGHGLPNHKLDTVAAHMGLPAKPKGLLEVKGKSYAEIVNEGLWSQLATYCHHDVAVTLEIARRLLHQFPAAELPVLSWTIESGLEGRFVLDCETLSEARQAEIDRIERLLAGRDRKYFLSNKKFVESLKAFGVDPPVKISPTTGQLTYALAKTDIPFLELAEHPDDRVASLVLTRLGVKTTIELSRIEKLLAIGADYGGMLPVPLAYAGAHTGRFSGSGGFNMQNIPSKSAINKCLLPPPDHLLVNIDWRQIECRLAFGLAGQMDKVHEMHSGADIYCDFASKAFGRPITKEHDPVERHLGKETVLSGQYGIGAETLHKRMCLKIKPMPTIEMTKQVHRAFRSYFNAAVWKELDVVLVRCATLPEETTWRCLRVGPNYIELPSGLRLNYPGLVIDPVEKSFSYKRRGYDARIWGGTLLENICQALAREVVVGKMRKLLPRYRVLLQVHDSLVFALPKALFNSHLETVLKVCKEPVEWWPELPLDVSVGWGETYEQAKRER